MTRGRADEAPAPFVGAATVRMETGEEFVRLCLPRDGYGPRLDRSEVARLKTLLEAAEAQFDALPDDSGRHVVPVEI